MILCMHGCNKVEKLLLNTKVNFLAVFHYRIKKLSIPTGTQFFPALEAKAQACTHESGQLRDCAWFGIYFLPTGLAISSAVPFNAALRPPKCQSCRTHQSNRPAWWLSQAYLHKDCGAQFVIPLKALDVCC